MTNKIPQDENNQKLTSGFNLASSGYDKPALRFLALTAKRLVELGNIQPGQTILDVATGTGNVALAAAKIVNPTGQVFGVDIAKDMLVQAECKVNQAGLTNITLQEGDVAQLDFSDHYFDAVFCASGLHFIADMLAALDEWRRVLKPGGLVAFSSFGEGMNSPLREILEARLLSYGVSIPPSELLHRLDKPDKSRNLLQEAGFQNIQTLTEQLGYYLSNVDEWWDIVWNSGYRAYISQLTQDKVEPFKVEHLAEISALATDKGIWLNVPVIFALAQKL
ncbi:MAG: methyltransferase domain-containing protein [Nostocaceae cyanobacterium]|nr:methyltransferase domain-containing protein [Nostocaceae cyanobacterium]